MIFSIFLIFVYCFLTFTVIKKIFNGDTFYLLVYLTLFLPFYSLFQLFIFKTSENIYLVNLIRYSKDFVIFSSFLVLVFGYKKNIIFREFKYTFLDKLVVAFSLISIIYTLIPLGLASFFDKVIYLKNILLISVVYFIGKSTNISVEKFKFLKKTLIFLLILAFCVASVEYLSGLHLHFILDYSNYNFVFYDTPSSGNFGLSWTFERGPDSPRFGSFFSNPLEYSANLLLFLTIPLFHIINVKTKRFYHFFLLILIFISFYFAYSRASIFSGILMILFALIYNKDFKFFIYLFLTTLFFLLLIYLFIPDDTLYYVIDTFTFNESSSLSHLLEWIQGGISIYENPFGIGLAMSGNASGVDQAIKVGGENQFLIYGVQMGLVFMLLYSVMLFKAIFDSMNLYKSLVNYQKELSFIGGMTKFGLLIPLFTANAELYLFISLFSWFLIGYIQNLKITKALNNY